jgi:hypothetical protein
MIVPLSTFANSLTDNEISGAHIASKFTGKNTANGSKNLLKYLPLFFLAAVICIIANVTSANDKVTLNDVVAAGSPVIPMMVPKKINQANAPMYGAKFLLHDFGKLSVTFLSMNFTNISAK